MTTILWAAGLLAALGALLYMAAYRRRYWWVESGVLNVPRTLTPLYLALTIFSVGLALLSFGNDEPIALWVAAIWSSLALLFGQQLWSSVLAGVQAGWDTQVGAPAEGEQAARGIPIWWAVTLVLLLLNAGLVVWSAGSRWREGTFHIDLRAILALPQIDGTADGTEVATATGALAGLGIATPTVTPTVQMETPTPAPVTIALPTPTPSPTPAPVVPTVTIAVEAGANARAQPTLDAEVFGIMLQGEQAAALGRSEDSAWIQIRMSDGRTAWIAASVITLNVEASSLPVATAN